MESYAARPGNTSDVAIELRFLTGSQRGTSHRFTARTITVGDDPACELQLPREDGPAGLTRHVRISGASSGWSLQNLGTSLVAVNHEVVGGDARLKSGDVIRLSPQGPELLFSIAPRPAAEPGGAGPRPVATAHESKPYLNSQSVPDSNAATTDSSPPVHAVLPRAAFWWSLAAATAVITLFFAAWAAFRPPSNPAIKLTEIPTQVAKEGETWELDLSKYVSLSRDGQPGFALLGNAPEGLQVDRISGVVRWCPTETQAPGSYPIEVEVHIVDHAVTRHANFTVVAEERNSLPRLEAIPDVTFIPGSKDALELQVVAADQDLPAQPLEFQLGANAPAGLYVDRDTGLVRWNPSPDQAGKTHAVEILVSDPDTRQSPQRLVFRVTVSEPVVAQQGETGVTDAVYLLIMEEPNSGTLFPFAVAFAVRDKLLLTTGYVAQELAQAREKGFDILAMHCKSRDVEDISTLLVSPEFLRLAGQPDRQIYVDLGAIVLIEKKRSLAALAADREPTELEQGIPLRCVMPVFEAEPLTRFDDVTPIFHNARTYLVTRRGATGSSDDTPRRLVHLVGSLPKNAQGSPLVNEQGDVVALYAEKADLSNDASLANLDGRYHYAICLDSFADMLDGDLKHWSQIPSSVGDPPERKQP